MCPSDGFPLSTPLSVLLSGQGGPLKLDVTLTTSDEVQALRQQVRELTSQLQELQAQLNRVEYLYRCETIINTKLVDHCRSARIPVPKTLFDRPY